MSDVFDGYSAPDVPEEVFRDIEGEFRTYREAFRKWEEHYRSRGYTVLNPAVLPEGLMPEEYMAICFTMLEVADAVAFLPGFESSRGAMLEMRFAEYADKPMIRAADGAVCGGTEWPHEG